MRNEFIIGETVRARDNDNHAIRKLRERHGDPPYTVTSISGEFVRVNGDDSGWGHTSLERMNLILDFIEPVAMTPYGTVYKHMKTGTYSLKTGERFTKLEDDQHNQVVQYLKNRKPFDDSLFKI